MKIRRRERGQPIFNGDLCVQRMVKSVRKIFFCFIAVIFFAVPCFALDTEVFFFRAPEARVPIVMYHLVTEKPRYLGKYGVTPAELEQDLIYLAENNYTTVVFQDLIDFVTRGDELPENPIMLTFDDGNFSDFAYVLPLLEQYDMKAVVAIIGEAADRFTAEAAKNPAARYPNLTWPQIAELHASGRVEIQSHAYDLHKAPLGSGKKRGESSEAYHARLLADLQKLQNACAEHLGYMPTAFVYPLGVIGEGSREVLEELGMMGSISCQEGENTVRQGDKDCLFRLHRTNRPGGRGIKDVIR
ncbi:MAG: polysaccharide deacetylase family protein [Defluviitaleaceae bacterium]|nr:polysaccharide deacetylase family protein [Defluviitaleaceae bacterium]